MALEHILSAAVGPLPQAPRATRANPRSQWPRASGRGRERAAIPGGHAHLAGVQLVASQLIPGRPPGAGRPTDPLRLWAPPRRPQLVRRKAPGERVRRHCARRPWRAPHAHLAGVQLVASQRIPGRPPGEGRPTDRCGGDHTWCGAKPRGSASVDIAHEGPRALRLPPPLCRALRLVPRKLSTAHAVRPLRAMRYAVQPRTARACGLHVIGHASMTDRSVCFRVRRRCARRPASSSQLSSKLSDFCM